MARGLGNALTGIGFARDGVLARGPRGQGWNTMRTTLVLVVAALLAVTVVPNQAQALNCTDKETPEELAECAYIQVRNLVQFLAPNLCWDYHVCL